MLGAVVHDELARLRQLSLVAAVDEVAYDVQFFHVLPGGELRGSCRYQATLRINHIRSEATGADFAQAADEELQVNHGGDRSQKTRSIVDGIADQEYGASGISFADDERLAVIGAPVTRGGKGALQFAIQKSVGSDAPRRNALGIGVQKSRISDFIRGRNEVFEQGPELRNPNVVFTNVTAARHLNGRRQVGQHHVQGALVLGKIVGQRAGDRILQQHLVGLQPVPVDGFYLRRVEIHRDDADDQKHTEDYVQNRYACVIRSAVGQVSPLNLSQSPGRSDGGSQRSP